MAVAASLLLLLLGQAATAASKEDVHRGHTFVELWSRSGHAPGLDVERSDGIKGYAVLGTGQGYSQIAARSLEPLPADGSIVSGGSVVEGRVDTSKGNADTSSISAHVALSRLDLLGGSPAGGISLDQVIVHEEHSCAGGIIDAGATFSRLRIAGQLVEGAPPPNAIYQLGPVTVILNEQHWNSQDLGVDLTGIHLIVPGAVPGTGVDLRLGSLVSTSHCAQRSGVPGAQLSFGLGAVGRRPSAGRPMKIRVSITNHAARPCLITSVDFQPGWNAWKTTGTSGDLGTALRPSSADTGNATLTPDALLPPGKTAWQEFVVAERPGRPREFSAGSHLEASCQESGIWSSGIGAYPTP